MFDFICGTVAAILSAQSHHASTPIKVAGYLDTYWQTNLSRSNGGDTINGRGLDPANDRPTISIAELDVSMDPKPFGFNLQLYAGRGTQLIHLAEPGGENKYRYIRQAYVSYAGKNLTVDFGKFDTWIGYEGIDNRSQDEYSRSFNWTYSEPTYETGFRIGTKLSPKLSANAYLVQGWSEVEDGNDGKTVGLGFNYTPDDKTSLALQNHFGDEGSVTANDAGSYGGIGFAAPGVSKVDLIDFIAIRQITPATKVAFNVDYASSIGGANRGHWNGEVLYLRHNLAPKQAIGVRAERFEDNDGLRTGFATKLYSLSGTYDYTVNDHLTMRFELRHDLASQAFFNDKDGLSKDRTTATIAAVVKF